ncbi:MAG TPA: AtzH-like domain-containing protein [Propionibacteriaceae bacterium]|nr:AtzH-like domain-containing protein [Propionibacteriaceae bacterium]
MSRAWAAATVEGIVPDSLWEAFWQYENALMANDLAMLSYLFAPGEHTVRADSTGVRIGHNAIMGFRVGRGPAAQRVITDCHVRMIDDRNAVIVATHAPDRGGWGVVTQWWTFRSESNQPSHWVIATTHVSSPPPAVDASVWRVVGTPLVPGARAGHAFEPLGGETVAVKDVFDVAGFSVGAGVPAYLAESLPAFRHAAAVATLLAAGADVRGIAQSDEFAYSITGCNPHSGTPPNVAVPEALPGGSSSGPAAAVALGHASIGLGTDTAGSIRVPASYQGLWGLRTSHGAVDSAGMVPLAPRFDSVGWLTRKPELLRTVAEASLDQARQVSAAAAVLVAPAAVAVASPEIRTAFEEAVTRLVAEGCIAPPEEVELPDLQQTSALFRTVQAAQAWQVHGRWVSAHPRSLSAPVAARFRYAKSVTPTQHARAVASIDRLRQSLDALLAGRVLLLPTTPTPAPQLDASEEDLETVRRRTVSLTCIAAIGGYPALSVPALSVGRAPVGLSVMGPRCTDLSLIDRGQTYADALRIAGAPPSSQATASKRA